MVMISMFAQKAMRPSINLILALCTGGLWAEELPMDYSSLWKVPDLSPQPTSNEVLKEFTPWADRAKKVAAGVKPDLAAFFFLKHALPLARSSRRSQG